VLTRRVFKQTSLLGATVLLAVLSDAAIPDVATRLEQSRNLGKAFYENPTTAAEAVVEFKKALDLAPASDREKLNYALALLHAGKSEAAVPILKAVQKHNPSLPHTWFNLGIYYKKSGEEDLAIGQFQRMVKLTPDEPIAHYQLGTLYKASKPAEAIAEFETARRLNPSLAAAHFQLFNLYRQAGRDSDGAAELQTFQELKKQQEGTAIAEDVDWCSYAEIYDPPRAVTPAPNTAPVYDESILEGSVDAKTAGMALIDSTGKGQTDFLVWSAQGAALYLQGTKRAADSGLGDLKGVVAIAPGDFDNDGLMDLCVLTESGAFVYRNTGGKFVKADISLPQRRFERAVWIDYDHDYDLDLVLLGDSPALYRNQGAAGFAERTSDFPFVAGHPVDAWKLRAVPDSKAFDLAVMYSNHAPVLYRDQLGGKYTTAAFNGGPRNITQIDADFDGDGRVDRVRVAPDGSLHYLHNRTVSQRHWIRVQLTGVKSLKLAQDAEVEIKAGQLYRKQLYDGFPLVFDTGAYATVDTVRITWSNGLIQNEVRQAANKSYKYEEAQRLSGSCPMIWTWSGTGFEFITDVLGVAPLGAADGDGSYFPVDHDEFVSIPGRALKAVNGYYDVRITEELSEVSYLDQVRLFALDHPANTEIFTNEKFKGPPYPEDRLFGVKHRIYPIAAREFSGTEPGGGAHDVLPLLLKTDQRYPDQFERRESGVAEMHTLEMDFAGAASSGRAALLLHGWVDWPDGSTFRAASQESKSGLVMPYLQMQDVAGKWQTVDPDMGMPAGKPKTIAVDLHFLSASRKVRIVTNLCVYWDEAFLSEDADPPIVKQREAALVSADLKFRGFSASRIDAARKQPDTYIYSSVSPTSYWNPTPGLYTRYGDVKELTQAVDDKLIIMASGDELKLRFRADEFPALPAGWTRDYLLKVDGWAKDRDPNTAYSTSVEPLPFHGMSVYPYPKEEHFPDDAAHDKYRREYNTRPALRLIRPLGL
jgi:tetratricopeptide (TPR) repeat protein